MENLLGHEERHVPRIRRFVRRHIGRLVIVELFDGTIFTGVILSSGLVTFRLRIRRRNRRIIIVIAFRKVRRIRLI
ncbi:acetyl-CoA acetyltransferase [Paenibacillus thiaminolyticus]|uniref:acetyl-CoA acetyltransferase n=1 Tax=Paenibacillus thiaminolyticus TaxID=49283 RepID=UPI0035A6C06A